MGCEGVGAWVWGVRVWVCGCEYPSYAIATATFHHPTILTPTKISTIIYYTSEIILGKVDDRRCFRMQEGRLLENIDDVGGNKKSFFSFSEQLSNNLCMFSAKVHILFH